MVVVVCVWWEGKGGGGGGGGGEVSKGVYDVVQQTDRQTY